MKILIVDDDPVSREILQKIVSNHGPHQISSVADATAAWALLDDPSRYFDIAFIDLVMPEVDGFQLLQRIRQEPLLNTLHVVICTGSKDRASLQKAVQLGARHYLVKPCTEPVVFAKLNQIHPPDPVKERALAGTG